MSGPLVGTLPNLYTEDEPGPYCNSHHSFFCPCVAQFLEDRGDVVALERLFADAPNREERGDFHVLVPVFPQFCVWEKLTYELAYDERIGVYGLLPEVVVKRHNLYGVRRLSVGESAGDLSHVIKQQFDDDLELEIGRLLGGAGMRPDLPWRCQGNRHSVKYQRVVDKIMQPHNVRQAWTGHGDLEVIKATVYCLMRHKRCLFCYVNENNRDAVRVNPDMQAVLGTQLQSSAADDFKDLIP